MRSPMMTGMEPISTALEKEDTTVRPFRSGGVTGMSRQAAVRARIWSGVVPQQPPSPHTPSFAMRSMTEANRSGFTSNTVLSPSRRGRPALGLTTTGTEDSFTSSSARGSICSGPMPQLTPRASTRRPSSRATVEAMVPPVSILPFSSYTVVTTTGRSLFSLAASTAALAS